MEDIIIQEKQRNCPAIVYHAASNVLEISGKSIPENPESVYRKLTDWFTSFIGTSASLELHIRLEYLNSSSSKYLFEALMHLSSLIVPGKKVKMKWFYDEDDESMRELGEHFCDSTGISTEFKPNV